MCVNVWPSFDRNQFTNSFAALGCGALANAEMQQPEPPARIKPTCLGRNICLIGIPFFAKAMSSSLPVATAWSGNLPPVSQVSRILRSSENVTPASRR